MYEEYRIALALRDFRAQDEVYPALCARRGEAVECAREALRSAKTAADRALAEKCLRFLEVPPPPGRHYHARSGS